MDRTSAILARGVKFLVCGAICRGSQRVLTGAGVKVACWRRGDVDDVVSALRDDALDDLAMPGCPGRACCRLSGAPGQGRRRGFGRGREALQGLDPRRAGQRFSIEGDEQ
ncbi:MAG: NifB/NifX family molybdenum-iron cluster-binding protein [Desulfovibrionaceae bacterium]